MPEAGVSAGASIPSNGDGGFFSNIFDIVGDTFQGFSEAFVKGATDTAPLWTSNLLGRDIGELIDDSTFQPTPKTRPGNVPNTAGQNNQTFAGNNGLLALLLIGGIGILLLSRGK